MITILIFLVVLGVLVFVHELGHFWAAKRAGVQIDEFGFGYPPRALVLGKRWGTLFTLNWIPFGGFVKIVGEDYEEQENASHILLQEHSLPLSKPEKIFTQVSKKWQAAILASGVLFNILFAWILLSIGFVIGLPTPADNNYGAPVEDPTLTIVGVAPDSPAQKVGLKTGDKIEGISLENGMVPQNLTPDDVSNFINQSSGKILLDIDRAGEKLNFDTVPATGIVEDKKVIGINMDIVGNLSLPLHKAIYEGGKTTLQLSYLTVWGIANLIVDAVRGEANLSQVAGPVGIIGLVGDASRLGFAYLLTFTALISINLAVINLVPFPALDGGRILFVAIEGVSKRKINTRVAQVVNTIGFALLILLMLVITYRDILRLV